MEFHLKNGRYIRLTNPISGSINPLAAFHTITEDVLVRYYVFARPSDKTANAAFAHY